MNVLVLGSDPRYESILHSLAAVPGHHVERVTDAGAAAAAVNVESFDALICAGPVRPVFSRIREFLADRKPVMVIPSAAQGSDAAYELLAIVEESGGELLAGFPHRYAPVWRKLCVRAQGATGEGRQLIQIERRLSNTKYSGVVPYQGVDELLLSDADLIRWLGTDYTEVTCLYTGATEGGVSRASVMLAGGLNSEATWTLQTHAGDEECHASLTADGSSFSTTESDGGLTGECAAGLLADLELAAAAKGPPPEAEWIDAVWAFDVVDAARRSVRRRRTVEISSGEVSERGQFKTKMTALGCTLLSFTLLGVVLALLVGAAFDPRDAMQRQSEAAGFVLRRDAFQPGTADLTDAARGQLQDISERLRETPAAIIVESSSSHADDRLDTARREAVVEYFRESVKLDLDERVVVRPLAGEGFQRFMTGLWIVVFLPLGVFLILQALIFITRSPDGRGGA